MLPSVLELPVVVPLLIGEFYCLVLRFLFYVLMITWIGRVTWLHWSSASSRLLLSPKYVRLLLLQAPSTFGQLKPVGRSMVV